MSLRAWLATRFSMLLLGAMALFVVGLFFARQAGARGEAAQLAQERARLAQLFLRQTSLAGAPITVRERRTDSLPSTGVQRALQLEPRVRELLNVVGGYLWVLSDTLLWSSRDARALDSLSLDAVNNALNEMREANAPSRAVLLGRTGVFGRPGVMVERLETLPNGLTLRVVAAVPLSAVALSPWELLGAAVVVMPLVLALAVGGAFLVAAQATEPLERITKEVAEISDGRSLHRRLQ